MLKHLTPNTIAKPASRYSHAVEIPANARTLYISGQVGNAPDGTLAKDFDGQADQAWRNLKAALEAAGMGLGDLVRVNYYLTNVANVGAFRAVREHYIKDPPPASTMIVVQSLASPAWLIEIEAVAAKV